MSELVLNRSAYIHNLTKICAKAGGKDRVILVLKDNAYGHGAALVGREAASYGIKFCAVKNEAEAREHLERAERATAAAQQAVAAAQKREDVSGNVTYLSQGSAAA